MVWPYNFHWAKLHQWYCDGESATEYFLEAPPGQHATVTSGNQPVIVMRGRATQSLASSELCKSGAKMLRDLLIACGFCAHAHCRGHDMAWIHHRSAIKMIGKACGVRVVSMESAVIANAPIDSGPWNWSTFLNQHWTPPWMLHHATR